MCHDVHVKVRRQLAGVSFVLLPCRSDASNLDCQTWQQATLLTKSSCNHSPTTKQEGDFTTDVIKSLDMSLQITNFTSEQLKINVINYGSYIK